MSDTENLLEENQALRARSGSYEAGNASHEWQSAKEGKQS